MKTKIFEKAVFLTHPNGFFLAKIVMSQLGEWVFMLFPNILVLVWYKMVLLDALFYKLFELCYLYHFSKGKY